MNSSQDQHRLRSQIFDSTSRKSDLIRANQDLSHEREVLMRRNRELEAGLLEKSKLLSKVAESLSKSMDETAPEVGAEESILELVKEVETFMESMEKKKMELSRNVELLEEENRDINVLLRAAFSEKQTAEKKLKEMNEEKRSALLQIAERGLQRIGFGFGFRESVQESSETENLEEEDGVVIAIDKTIKNLRKEISQLELSLLESRLEEERLKKFTQNQAQKLEENIVYIDKLQNRKRFLTQKVDELVKLVREDEWEIRRWREACELEVEAGQREITQRDQLIAVFKAEVENMRSALAISEGKLKLKEELAKAAMVAEEAAEKSLRLAERRIAELLSRTEHLYRQLEEAESTEHRRGKFRYIWCWPFWRFPIADHSSMTATSYANKRALLRYGG